MLTLTPYYVHGGAAYCIDYIRTVQADKARELNGLRAE